MTLSPENSSALTLHFNLHLKNGLANVMLWWRIIKGRHVFIDPKNLRNMLTTESGCQILEWTNKSEHMRSPCPYSKACWALFFRRTSAVHFLPQPDVSNSLEGRPLGWLGQGGGGNPRHQWFFLRLYLELCWSLISWMGEGYKERHTMEKKIMKRGWYRIKNEKLFRKIS